MCRFMFEFETNWPIEDYESAGFSFEKACIDSETSIQFNSILYSHYSFYKEIKKIT